MDIPTTLLRSGRAFGLPDPTDPRIHTIPLLDGRIEVGRCPAADGADACITLDLTDSGIVPANVVCSATPASALALAYAIIAQATDTRVAAIGGGRVRRWSVEEV